MSSLLLFTVSILYLLLLFLIASWVEKRAHLTKSNLVKNPYVYALSWAIYCTAWTFYGSVGQAVSSGTVFLAVFIGPTILMPFGWFIYRKLIRISKVQRITNLADFVSARYGKSRLLGGIVTLLCVLGLIPYISIQIKSIANSFQILVINDHSLSEHNFWGDNTLYIVFALGVFAILFGTRKLEANERHEGLIAAIAFESILKLVAFLSVGIFVCYVVFNSFSDITQKAAQLPDLQRIFIIKEDSLDTWFWHSLLSGLAFLFLPRQFQVAVVENTRESHLRKAIWLFPLYLLVINLFVLPIAFGGYITFGNTVKADQYVLALPLHFNQQFLALFTYLGGFSAATSMIIVECTALTVMLSNNLVLPIIVESQPWADRVGNNLGNWVLNLRRIFVAIILLFAFLYYKYISDRYTLVSVGLISFAAVAQLAPAIIGGLFWKQGNSRGALWGIIAGWCMWFYTLIIPGMVSANFLPQQWLVNGPLGIDWLHPERLFGLTQLDSLSHGVFWSLLANIGGYIIGSLQFRPTAQEQNQAELFVDIFKYSERYESSIVWKGKAITKDVQSILGSFIGHARAERLINLYAKRHNLNLKNTYADPRIVNYAEKLLGGAIGTASARRLIASVAKEEKITIEDVIEILKTSRELQLLNEELRRKSADLERLTNQLTTANERLKRIDHQKDDFLSMVTHEIRTPLTSIRALSEILQDNPDMETEQKHHFLNTIINESIRLTRLVNEVLDLERIENGKVNLSEDIFTIKQVIEESLNSVRQLAAEKAIIIQTFYEGNIQPIKADHDRFIQVIINLVSNSIKFCYPELGVIQIKVVQDADLLSVAITDNGSGIEHEFLPLVFDKFYQAKKNKHAKHVGSGLGLAITKKIIELYEGEITVESQPKVFTTFAFTIPLKNLVLEKN